MVRVGLERILLSAAIGFGLLLAAPPAGGGFLAPITWNSIVVTAVVPAGESRTREVSFVASQNLTDVVAAPSAALQANVQVSPSTFAHIARGQATRLTLTFTAPTGARRRTVAGTLQLRAGGRTLAWPLPILIQIRASEAPLATDDHYATGEDTPLVVGSPGVLMNDNAADGGALSAVLVTRPSFAVSFALNADGSFSYAPAPDFTGTDSFTYRATDASGRSSVATATIEVLPADDSPVATNDVYLTDEDTPLVVDAPGILLNDNDADADFLTAVLVSGPSHALSFALNPDGSFSYAPALDFTGTDTFAYRATDGTRESNVAMVTITVRAVNDTPVATNDHYETVEDTPLTVTAPGVLGNDTDAEGNSLTAVLVSGPSHALSFALNPDGSFDYAPAADFTGADTFTYKASDGTVDGNVAMVTITITPVNDLPAARDDAYSTAEETVLVVAAPGVLANDTDPEGGSLTAELVAGPLHAASFSLNSEGSFSYTPAADFHGIDTFGYRARDASGAVSGVATVQVTVTPVNDPPVALHDGFETTQGVALVVTAPGVLGNDTDVDGEALTAILVSPPASGSLALNADGSFTYTPAAAFSGTDSFAYRPHDGTTGGNVATATITVTPSGPPLPPDPVTVAPPVDRAVATTVFASTAFLYSGPTPIQTGVPPGTIEVRRAAVLRGKVATRDGVALPGVTLTVLNHPEFGQTLSRADGMFDLAVNGGGVLTVNYEKAGFLRAQRQVTAPWQDYAFLPDVVLIPSNPNVTTVDLGAPVSMQVARGSVATDADGSRQATLLFRQGTQAEVFRPDGSTQPVRTLTLRLTEYTVGPSGSAAMPGELPPTTAYTYAVELSAAEAPVKIGGRDVLLSQPAFFYVENFLGIPVGHAVPVGFYDADRASWVPSPDGQVVRIIAISGDLADLDTDGDASADNGTALGITEAERRQLAALYGVGQSLWRVPVTHFSTYDLNIARGCLSGEQDAAGQSLPCAVPKLPRPTGEELVDDACTVPGSIIECQNQVLGEAVRVVGTPFALHYQSERVPGRKAAYTLDISLSEGVTLQSGVQRIDLMVQVAGRTIVVPGFPAAAGQRASFTWDGQDAYGRTVQGAQLVTVSVCFVYRQVAGTSSARGGGRSFGRATLSAATFATRSRLGEVGLCQTVGKTTLGTFDARSAGVGGWTLSVQHAYDPIAKVLYQGDGRRRTAKAQAPVISTFAGTGGSSPLGDGGPATRANLPSPGGLALGPDGSLYIADGARARRVAPDGIVTTVAGSGANCAPNTAPCGDGGPATAAQMDSVEDVAIGPDGSLYLVDSGTARVRRVHPGADGIVTGAPDEVISTLAGTGVSGTSGDGGPATAAQLQTVRAVAVGADGSVYIGQAGRVRQVTPDGIITTFAGNGQCLGPFVAGRPATSVPLCPQDLAVAADGSVYIVSSPQQVGVHRVTPDGIITTVARTPGSPLGFGGDGGPATDALFRSPIAIALGPDGSLYIADANNHHVRRVTTDGIINTVAGIPADGSTGNFGFDGDGGPATAARMTSPAGLAVAPDGVLFISANRRVRRVGPVLPAVFDVDFLVAAEDGSQVHLFNGFGRHLRTLDALTGGLRYQFAYDDGGRLRTVIDGDGNVTSIERGPGGDPLAIAAPFGQRTTLSVDAAGFLASIANPASEAVQASYTADGLLTAFTNARGFTSRYEYDALGRLVRAEDPTGAATTLARTDFRNEVSAGYVVTHTTPLGRQTRYQVEVLSTGHRRFEDTFPDGTRTEVLIRNDRIHTTRFPDGRETTLVEGPDPRWGMQAPLAKNLTISTPNGLTFSATTQVSVTLTEPADPLSIESSTETVTLNGRAFTTTYSGSSRTITERTAQGRLANRALDAQGRLVRTAVTGLDAIDYRYDSRGRLHTIVQGTGATARTATLRYDSAGFLDRFTDPLGRITTFVHDTAGRLSRQIQPDGTVLALGYDANGNVTRVIPPGRPEHAFTYDRVDLMSTYAPPDIGAGSNVTVDTYNADRQLTRIALPTGQHVDLSYAPQSGRLTAAALPRGQRTYQYGATGHLTAISDPDRSVLSYDYDGGLLTGTAWSLETLGRVSRAYDNDFRIIAQSVNDANPIALQYEGDDLLVAAGGLALTRDAQNGLIRSTTLGDVSEELSYNGFGELVSHDVSFSGSPIFSVQYTRDQVGRIIQQTETVGGVTDTVAYVYDQLSQLSDVRRNGVTTATYTYDPNGNRLTGPGAVNTYTYDQQDRLVTRDATIGTRGYDYTADGRLLTKTTGDQTTAYHYDELGNLLRVELPSGTQIDYVVDGRGRRVAKKVNGTKIQGFLYADGLKLIAELDGDDNVVSRFVYADGLTVPVYMTRNGITYRIVTDHLGSPRLLIDVTTGMVAQRIDYDEFGTVTNDTSPGFQPFGFAGGILDSDTNLVRYGLRDLDPETGRWTAKDPGGFASGPNLYIYADNDPVNLVDPLGSNPGDTIISNRGWGLNAIPRGAWLRAFEQFRGIFTSGEIQTPGTLPRLRNLVPRGASQRAFEQFRGPATSGEITTPGTLPRTSCKPPSALGRAMSIGSRVLGVLGGAILVLDVVDAIRHYNDPIDVQGEVFPGVCTTVCLEDG